jgi:hypothetical protein
MSNIKVGDLVMVVQPQPCCGKKNTIGIVFTVKKISSGSTRCGYCHARYPSEIAYGKSDGLPTLTHRLIKIDPPALPESLEREKILEV